MRGADEKPIRELADIVFHPEVPELRAASMAPLEERFVRAEMEYRSKGSRGVAEADVVRLFDELAQSLGAPAYVKTSSEEVRGLRLTISRHAPHFIPRAPADDKGAFTVGERMSPLEAAYIINHLLLQKRSNTSFQLTAEERADVRRGLQRLEESGARLTD